jgi:hypothetical protein
MTTSGFMVLPGAHAEVIPMKQNYHRRLLFRSLEALFDPGVPAISFAAESVGLFG